MRSALPLLFLIAGLLAACGNQAPEATDLWEAATIRKAVERGKLIVALEPEFPPFEYKDDDAKLVGFDVDLARMIAAEAGIDVEFLEVKWESIVPTLVSGQADLIISGRTVTPERALTTSYSDPYFHTRTCLLVSTSRGKDVKGIADLDDPKRVVAVKEGTTGHVAARKRCPKATIRSFPSENTAALEVAQGKADAFVYDLWSINNHHRRNPDTTRVIPDAITIEPYAITCRKGDPETLDWLNLVLRQLRLDGRLEELYAKYGLEDAPPR